MSLLIRLSLVLTLAGVTSSAFAHADKDAFREAFLSGQASWSDVLASAAQEGAVDFYYWGGDDRLNVWLERTVAPKMADLGITLRPHRITSTRDAVDLVLAEARSGKSLGEGSVDVIWVNGENFYTLAEQNLLYGSFAQLLPNASHYEWDANDTRGLLNLYDFGYPTQGREMPWSGEQYVCAVNRALLPIAETPSTFGDLEVWLTEHPGTFTYVKPPHYLGNTFVQEALYAMSPLGAVGFQKPLDSFTPESLAQLITPGMAYLKRLAPLLANARKGAVRYPENETALMNLFQNSQIAMECQFGLYHVATKTAAGQMPPNVEEIIFPVNNMIKNKNYLALTGNAPQPAAALVFINYMSSVEAQQSKLSDVGYPLGIDLWRLSPTDQKLVTAAMPRHFGVTQAALDDNIAPDIHASLVTVIETVWQSYVEQGSSVPIEEMIRDVMSR